MAKKSANKDYIKTIEDFRARKTEKDRTDTDFLKTLDAAFQASERGIKQHREESEDIKKFYDNKEPVDFFRQANNDPIELKKLFKSGLIAKTVNVRSSIMTDQRPKVQFNPIFRQDALMEFIKNIQEQPAWVQEMLQTSGSAEIFFDYIVDCAFEEWWDKAEFKQTMYILIKDSLLSSKSWLKLIKEDTNIVAKNVPFVYVSEDPNALYRDTRKFYFETVVTDVRDVERIFKLEKGSIKPEEKYSDKMPEYRDINKYDNELDKYAVPRVRIVTGYFIDNTTVSFNTPSEPIYDDMGRQMWDEMGNPLMSQSKVIERKLYPNGRKIVFICGQDDTKTYSGIKVISDEPCKYSRFELQDYVPEPDTEITGRPITRDLLPVQLLADKSMQQAIINFETVGNAKVFYVENEITDTSKLSNAVAIKIPVSSQGDIHYEAGIPTINEGTALYGIFTNVARDISGMNEIAEGKRMPNMESGRALVTLSENVNRSIRPSMRFFEDFLRRIFTVWGEMFLEIADKGYAVRFGKTYFERKELPFNLSDYIEGFDVFIIEDSTVPKDELTKVNQALTLAGMTFEDGMPGMDRRSVMEILGIDNYEQIQIRLEESIKLRQQLEQMQQVIQQQQAQLQQFGEYVNKKQVEEEQGNTKIKTELIKSKTALDMTAANNQTSLMRENMRQDGNLKRIAFTNSFKQKEGNQNPKG